MTLLAGVFAVVGVLVVAFLAMWFISPERFYQFREAVRRLRAAELIERRGSTKSTASREWWSVLLEPRRRGRDIGISDVRERVFEIREQYFLVDTAGGSRLPSSTAAPVDLGIVELSSLIARIAHQLRQDAGLVGSIVSAEEVLSAVSALATNRDATAPSANAAPKLDALIAASVTERTHSEHVLEQLLARPMSIEQLTEMLIAVVLALSLRVEGQTKPIRL